MTNIKTFIQITHTHIYTYLISNPKPYSLGADKVQCEICSRILGARDQYVVHMKRLHKMDVTKSNTGR